MLLLTSIVGLGSTPDPASAAVTVSSVDTSKTTYDKYALMVDGKPFFHSGVQFRYEKHKYTFGWTDAQLEPVLKMISDDGFNVVNIPIWWSKVETAKDTFDWADINRYIDWCKKYNLKLELLWFGHESTGITLAPRLPAYVMNDYQFVLKSDGTRLTLNGNNLLDKTDPNLLAREKYVLGQLMGHIAAYDTGHTIVGAQVLNEPNVANMQFGASSDRSYSTYSTQRWNAGGYTNAAQFRRDVLLDYVNQLGQVIKQSDYSVYTRVNVVGDAEPVTENEDLRAQGASHIDFFGDDPYTTNNDSLFGYGTNAFWAQGKNFPMIMENYGGNNFADVQKFNTIAGNGVHNFYAALDPDSSTGNSNHGLYNFNPTTKVVSRDTVSNNVANLNRMLNKIGRDLATKSPVEAGGSKLQTFNRAAAASVTGVVKPLDNMNITFTTANGGQGIAVKRSSSGVALLSTRSATYTLPGSYGAVASVETGHYDANDLWVSAGPKSFDTSTGNTVINLNAGECVRVLFTLPSLVSGATYKIRNAASGRYLDTELDGVVTLAPKTTYDDQDWVVTKNTAGHWTIKNVRTGRNYLDTDATDNSVIWNSGEVLDDSLWNVEAIGNGLFRVDNKRPDRGYMYATSTNELKWNTGSTDSTTDWVFEQK
ncbi:hypothetical protein ALI22I_03075 [Saccharothrix sp. ALI-22-I]|nr:hypothetical protein ALI22I_03075 [Saccharothrix sp. ALI-22-I]